MPARLSVWCCYLLRSLPSPLSTYIGFTNDPAKRLRQHNGELTSGARRTHKRRPWELVLIVAGFPSQVSALQFEWAWQHPNFSKAVRGHVAGLAKQRGASPKARIMRTMLTLEPWCGMPLRLHYCDARLRAEGEALPLPLPPHIATRTTGGPVEGMWMYAEAAALLAEAKAAKAALRAEGAAAAKAARAAQRLGKGGAGSSAGAGAGAAALPPTHMIYEDSGTESEARSSLLSLAPSALPSPAPAAAAAAGGKRRRSSLHRVKVRKATGRAIAVEEEGEEEEGRTGGSQLPSPSQASFNEREEEEEEEEEVIVVEEEEGCSEEECEVIEMGDEGLSEEEDAEGPGEALLAGGARSASASASASAVQEVDELLTLSLAERLRRRLEGGGGGAGSSSSSSSLVSQLQTPQCPCCHSAVDTGSVLGPWLRCSCGSAFHAACAASHFLRVQAAVRGGGAQAAASASVPLPAPPTIVALLPAPLPVACPAGCGRALLWPTLVEEALQRGYKAPKLDSFAYLVGPGEAKSRKRQRKQGSK